MFIRFGYKYAVSAQAEYYGRVVMWDTVLWAVTVLSNLLKNWITELASNIVWGMFSNCSGNSEKKLEMYRIVPKCSGNVEGRDLSSRVKWYA